MGYSFNSLATIIEYSPRTSAFAVILATIASAYSLTIYVSIVTSVENWLLLTRRLCLRYQRYFQSLAVSPGRMFSWGLNDKPANLRHRLSPYIMKVSKATCYRSTVEGHTFSRSFDSKPELLSLVGCFPFRKSAALTAWLWKGIRIRQTWKTYESGIDRALSEANVVGVTGLSISTSNCSSASVADGTMSML